MSAKSEEQRGEARVREERRVEEVGASSSSRATQHRRRREERSNARVHCEHSRHSRAR